MVKKIVSYEYRSPWFNTRINRKPDMIILHASQPSLDYYNCTSVKFELDVYTNPEGILRKLELSPHYYILDDQKFVNGEVYSTVLNLVNPNNVAHHAGKLNETSLGVELRGYNNQSITSAQFNSLCAVVQFLIEKYDIPVNRVLGHFEVDSDRKDDPGKKVVEAVRNEMIDRLHKEALIVDAHQDTLVNVLDSGVDLSKESDAYEADIPRMRRGNLGVAFFALYTKASYKNKGKRLKQLVECFEKTMKNNSEDLMQIRLLKDLDKLEGKIGVVLSVEGAAGIGSDVSLDDLYMAGLKCLSLTHDSQNQYATGVAGNPKRGITKKGKDLVERMKRLDIIVDVSHLNEKSFWDVMECSQRPVIASHSNVFNVQPHIRNLKDDQIKAIAKKGGVIGINFCRYFIGYQRRAANLVYHIDYLVKLVGIDHVGLGSDFGILCGEVPKGLEDVSKLKNLTKELVVKGYKNSEIRKILGLNYVRLFEKSWK